MTTHYKIILFYDIPNKNKTEQKKYRKFYKFITKIGFIILQESVYVKTINTKSTYEILKKELKHVSPQICEIRTILLTEKEYEKLFLIKGKLTLNDQILSNKTRILQF